MGDIQTQLILSLVIVFLISTFTAVIIVFVKRTQGKKRQTLENLAAALGAQLQGSKIAGVYYDMSYLCHHVPKNKDAPAQFVIRVLGKFAETFTVRKEGAFDRLSKRIGLVREAQTGDKIFDDEFYIEAGNRQFMEIYLMDDNRKRTIRELFRFPIKRIALRRKHLEINLQGLELKDIDPENIKEVLSRCNDLIKGIPSSMAFSQSGKAAISPRKLMLTMIISLGGLTSAGFASLLIGSVKYKPLDSILFPSLSFAFSYALIITVIFSFVCYNFIKNRSDAHKIMIICIIGALVSSMFCGAGYYVFSNGYLDTSPEQKHTARVISRKIKKSDKSTDYLLFVSSWREGKSTEKIEVRSRFYAQTTEGNEIVITTRAGYQGFEWLVGYDHSE